MNTKTTFQPRTVGLLVTALLAAGLFSGCSDEGCEESRYDGVVVTHPSGQRLRLVHRFGVNYMLEQEYTTVTFTGDTVSDFQPCR